MLKRRGWRESCGLSGAGAAFVCAGRTRDGDLLMTMRPMVRYMSTAIEYSQERPVLIDHFLEDAQWSAMWMRCVMATMW